MPQFGIASPDEVKALSRAPHRTWTTIRPYIDFLQTVRPESWAFIVLEAEDDPRAAKMRLSKAANELDKRIKWAPKGKQSDNKFYFKLLTPEEHAREKALRRRNGSRHE